MQLYQSSFQVLKTYYAERSFLKNLIDIYLKKHQIEQPQMLTDYVYGIVRHDLYLDFVLEHFVKKIKNKDRIYFKILLYNLLIKKNTKKEVFTNDFIRFIKKQFGYKKAGFYNSVARKVLADTAFLAQVKENKQIYYSVPKELYQYIEKEIHDPALRDVILNKMIEVPNFYLRINKPALGEKYKKNRVWKNIYRLDENLKLSQFKAELKNQDIVVQDISSQMIPHILNPKPQDKIADFCSAPGGKSLLLSELTQHQATILSIELEPARFEKLSKNLEAHKNITPLLADATKPIILKEKQAVFDKILVDAPCSALGTISKSPDKKYRFSEMNLQEYTSIQVQILNNALKHLKTGGELVFSLCTFTKEECINTINQFLQENEKQVKLLDFETPDNIFKGNKLHTAYYYHGDLFFIAKFKKL